MKPIEFQQLVAEMRAAQKEYFNPKTRTLEVLNKSKQLEKKVDEALIEFNKPKETQSTLF
jgi:hypothetical protein